MAQDWVKHDFARLALERLERSQNDDYSGLFSKDFFSDIPASHIERVGVGILEDRDMASELSDSWFIADDDKTHSDGITNSARAAVTTGAHASGLTSAGVQTPADHSSSLEDLEQSFRQRGRSISFDPEATLDNGTRKPLQDTVPHVTESVETECSQDKRSSGTHLDNIADETSANSSPLMLAQRQHAHSEPPSTNTSVRRRRILRPSIVPASMTTASTASPVQSGVITPQSPFEQSPTTMSSPCFPPLPDAASTEPWTLYRQNSFRSARNFSSSRQTSLRRISRNSSTKRSASSSFSPASAFLSRWATGDNSSIPESDAEGQTFGDENEYIIGRQIGQGGFGVVKETFLLSEGEKNKYAVKIIRKPLVSPDKPESPAVEHFQQQLEHEIGMWRHLENKHVISLKTVFESDVATFCVMDLCNGGSLYDLILRHRKSGTKGLDAVLAKSYAFQLSCAIRYLHQDIRVVHRDVKLENCLLHHQDADLHDTNAALLRICDFGLSDFMTLDSPVMKPNELQQKIESNDDSTPSTAGITGSLDYVAPETLAASRSSSVDEHQPLMPQVDIWALGVCIYAILTGERPFKHALTAQLAEQILAASWNEETVRSCPASVADDGAHAEDIVKLIRGCLDPDTKTRWTITQVLDSPWFSDCGDPCA